AALEIDVVEEPADKDFVVGLHREGVDRPIAAAAGIKALVNRSVFIELGHALADEAVETRELAPHDNLLASGASIHQADRPDSAIGRVTGIKRKVEGAIFVQSRHTRALCAVEGGEVAHDNNLSIALNSHAFDGAIRAISREEGIVECAVR